MLVKKKTKDEGEKLSTNKERNYKRSKHIRMKITLFANTVNLTFFKKEKSSFGCTAERCDESQLQLDLDLKV